MTDTDTSWEDDMQKANEQRQSSGGASEFHKFSVGEHVMRIMTKPIRKESRFGYGLCYPGAPYCNPDLLEAEYDKKMVTYG